MVYERQLCKGGFGFFFFMYRGSKWQVLEMEKNFRKKLKLRDGEEKMSSLGQLEGLETVRILILRRKERNFGEKWKD